MANCTNCTEDGVYGPGNSILAVILMLLLIVILILFVGTIILLCKAHSVVRILRVFLVNLLVAGLVTTLVALVIAMVTLVRDNSPAVSPDVLCRFLIWGLQSGNTARLYSLATFSLIVLSIVRYHKKDIKTAYIIGLLVLIWSLSLLLNLYVFIPKVYGVQYYDNVFCFPNNADEKVVLEARITFTILGIIFDSIVPIVTSIVVPIVVLFYTKRNTITTEQPSYNKGVARLALFLVVGNLLSFLGVLITSILAYVFESFTAAVQLIYTISVVFLLPTPILVIAFLKPVREQFHSLLRCCSRRQSMRLPKNLTKKLVYTEVMHVEN